MPRVKLSRVKLWRLFRSLAAGAAATAVDMGVLVLAISVLGVSARWANVPALFAGATVQFFGNRHFAFDAARGSLSRQAGWFVLSELVTVALNGLGYDWVARTVSLDTIGALFVRGAISFSVFALWSYPVWRRIFRGAPAEAT